MGHVHRIVQNTQEGNGLEAGRIIKQEFNTPTHTINSAHGFMMKILGQKPAANLKDVPSKIAEFEELVRLYDEHKDDFSTKICSWEFLTNYCLLT